MKMKVKIQRKSFKNGFKKKKRQNCKNRLTSIREKKKRFWNKNKIFIIKIEVKVYFK